MDTFVWTPHKDWHIRAFPGLNRPLAHLLLSRQVPYKGTYLQLFWHLNQGSKMGVMNVSMRQRSTCAMVTQWQSIFTVIVEATSRARTIG